MALAMSCDDIVRCFRLICLALALIVSCNATNRTVAERCVLIDLQGHEGKKLFPLLDDFAQRNDLVSDKSHPISLRFERRISNVVAAEVVYTIGLGKYGAELSLFRFDTSNHADLFRAFDNFVKLELAPRFGVVDCAAVPNYQLPEVYR